MLKKVTRDKSHIISIMSRQIHIPNFKSISQERLRKVRKTEWTDGQTYRRTDGRTKGGRTGRQKNRQTNRWRGNL